jgi:AraC-like DNA-binding protein
MDYELNLERLANQLQMPEKELSILINHYLGKHFFDFVNTYRINEAKSILADPEFEDKTILEILYQVGFNSKSSFYTAFKKATGNTPTQYRKDRATL